MSKDEGWFCFAVTKMDTGQYLAVEGQNVDMPIMELFPYAYGTDPYHAIRQLCHVLGGTWKEAHRAKTPRPPIPPIADVFGPVKPDLFDRICDWLQWVLVAMIDRLAKRRSGYDE
jgi:hypothetical protein